MAIATTEETQTMISQAWSEAQANVANATAKLQSGWENNVVAHFRMAQFAFDAPKLSANEQTHLARLKQEPALAGIYETAKNEFNEAIRDALPRVSGDVRENMTESLANNGAERFAYVVTQEASEAQGVLQSAKFFIKAVFEKFVSPETYPDGLSVGQRAHENGAYQVANDVLNNLMEQGMPEPHAREAAGDLYKAALAESGIAMRDSDAYFSELSGNAIAGNIQAVNLQTGNVAIAVDEVASIVQARKQLPELAAIATASQGLAIATGDNPALTTPTFLAARQTVSQEEIVSLIGVIDAAGGAFHDTPIYQQYARVAEVMAQDPDMQNIMQAANGGGYPGQDGQSMLRQRAVESLAADSEFSISRENYNTLVDTLAEKGLGDAYYLQNPKVRNYTQAEVIADAKSRGIITEAFASGKEFKGDVNKAAEFLLSQEAGFFSREGNDLYTPSDIPMLTQAEIAKYSPAVEARNGSDIESHIIHEQMASLEDPEVKALRDNYSVSELVNNQNLREYLAGSGVLSEDQRQVVAQLETRSFNPAYNIADKQELLSVGGAPIARLSVDELKIAGIDELVMSPDVVERLTSLSSQQLQVLEENKSPLLSYLYKGEGDVQTALDNMRLAQGYGATVQNNDFKLPTLEAQNNIMAGYGKAAATETSIGAKEVPNLPDKEDPIAEEPVTVSALPPRGNPFGGNGLEQLAMLKEAGANSLTSVAAGVVKTSTEHRNPKAEQGQGNLIG